MALLNTEQSDNVAETILSIIQGTGLIKYDGNSKADPHAWDVSRNLVSGFAASFIEQILVIENLIAWLEASGLDDDHSLDDGGEHQQLIEARRVLRDAKNYIEVWDK